MNSAAAPTAPKFLPLPCYCCGGSGVDRDTAHLPKDEQERCGDCKGYGLLCGTCVGLGRTSAVLGAPACPDCNGSGVHTAAGRKV